MELQQYWRRAGRRRWILLLLPGLAAVGALPLALRQPPRYTATATIVLLSNETAPSPPAVNQIVADFQSLVSAEPLLERVARQTGEPIGALRSNLTVKQIGAGDLAELSYTGTRPGKATDVVQAAGSIAYDTLFGSRVATAREQLRFAQQYEQSVHAALAPEASSSNGASQAEQQAGDVVGQAQQQLALMEGLQAYGASGGVTIGATRALPVLHDRIETVARAVLLALLLAAGTLTVAELARSTGRRGVAGDRTAAVGSRRSLEADLPATAERVWLDGRH
jgi:hypothetical protein